MSNVCLATSWSNYNAIVGPFVTDFRSSSMRNVTRRLGFATLSRAANAAKELDVEAMRDTKTELFKVYPAIDRSYNNAATQNFFADFRSLPADGPISSLTFPVENMNSKTFTLNRAISAVELDALVKRDLEAMDEMRAELSRLPLGGEVVNPSMMYHDAWVGSLWQGLGVGWHGDFSSYLILSFYRRIVPDEFQTPGHMRLVIALCVAYELYTLSTLLVDDAFDGTQVRYGRPTWLNRHPVSTYNDGNLCRELATLVFDHILPSEHPLKETINTMYKAYTRRSAYYFGCFSWEESQKAAQKQRNFPLKVLGGFEAYFSHNYYRAEQYVNSMIDLARLLACYPAIREEPFYAYVTLFNLVISIVEDWGDNAGPDALEDILGGVVHNIFLAVTIQERNKLHAAGKDKEAEEITCCMEKNYGTGLEEDARKVKELWRKYDITARVKDLLAELASEWQLRARGGKYDVQVADGSVREHEDFQFEIPHEVFTSAALHLFLLDSTYGHLRRQENDEKDKSLHGADGWDLIWAHINRHS